MSPWSTSRATPSPGSSPCPSRRPSTAPSITGSGGGSRRCSPTSRPGASGWRTASSVTRSGSRACSRSWRWRWTGRGPPACGRPRVRPCRPKKSPGATGAEGGPRPDLPLQAWPAPHPTPPAVPRPAPAPLERLAELMDGKVDQPVDIDGWKPENADGRFRGEVTLRQAFAQSINTVAAQLLQRVGPQRVIDLARGLGVASPLSPDPTLALGTSGVTLLEMTRAYAAVAADRASVEPFAVRSVSGARGETFYARQLPADAPPPWPRQQALDLLLAAVRAGTGRTPPTTGRPPARPGPRRTTATPGSSASPPTRSWACGSATTTTRRCATS